MGKVTQLWKDMAITAVAIWAQLAKKGLKLEEWISRIGRKLRELISKYKISTVVDWLLTEMEIFSALSPAPVTSGQHWLG